MSEIVNSRVMQETDVKEGRLSECIKKKIEVWCWFETEVKDQKLNLAMVGWEAC